MIARAISFEIPRNVRQTSVEAASEKLSSNRPLKLLGGSGLWTTDLECVRVRVPNAFLYDMGFRV